MHDAPETTPEAAVEIIPAGTPERSAAKQRIKLAFIGGTATLAYLSKSEGVPYVTVQKWSSEENWGDLKRAALQKTDAKVAENISSWIAEQRVVQIKRSVSRAAKLQAKADQILPNITEASELQSMATAEEKVDTIVRRNLGMDSEHPGGSAVTVNILAGGVQLS